MTSHLMLALGILVLGSCREKGEVHHFRVKKTTRPPAPSNPRYTWTLPAGWTAQPAGGMRLATIIIPTPDTTLQASVTEFGGDTPGNVNRWRKQLNLPPVPEKEILSTLEEIHTGLGKGYIVPLSNPATPDKALLAAIIPRPSGTSVFIKVTGTASGLKTIAVSFRQFVRSLSAHE